MMIKRSFTGGPDRLGCNSSDRRVGPWTLVRDNYWHAPVWTRKGPEGYRNTFNDEVAYVSLAGFGAFAPDGVTEETGHVWGDNKRTIERDANIERLKREMDATLISFGWDVDDSTYVPPVHKTFWQKLRAFVLGGNHDKATSR